MAIRLRVYGIDDAIPFALGCLAKYRPPRRGEGLHEDGVQLQPQMGVSHRGNRHRLAYP
jgi:hypothetical protein